MKCQKCSRAAVIHLTEMVDDTGGGKRAVEIHLCLAHGVEAGLVAPGTELNPHPGNVGVPPLLSKPAAPIPVTGEAAAAIVPSGKPPIGLTVQPKAPAADADPRACPICGMTWAVFKQHGQVGCPNDYAFFEARLLPIIKRTQEAASQHAGKVPAGLRQSAAASAVTTARLRRELQHAIDAEDYEHAAKLRDQIKNLGEN